MLMGIQCHHFFSIQTYFKKFRKTKVVRTVEEKFASDNFNFKTNIDYAHKPSHTGGSRASTRHFPASSYKHISIRMAQEAASRNTKIKPANLFWAHPLEAPWHQAPDSPHPIATLSFKGQRPLLLRQTLHLLFSQAGGVSPENSQATHACQK